MIMAKVLTAYNDKVQIIANGEIIKLTRNEFESKLKQGEIQINMPTVSCIDVTRDSNNNNIVSYLLKDDAQKQKWVTPEQLKSAIYNYRLICDSVSLTSDFKLKQRNVKYEVEATLASIKMLGNMSGTIKTGCDTPCIYVDYSENEHLLVIPNEVTDLYDFNCCDSNISNYIRNIHGKLTVIGGCNLDSMYHMFSCCRLKILDLSLLDTSNVTDMRYMFAESEVEYGIDLSSFDTSNVKDMEEMFTRCKSSRLIINSFNTRNVYDMNNMFSFCEVPELDLSSFDTRNVTNMIAMFVHCTSSLIVISNFCINERTSTNKMFYNCSSEIIASTDKRLLAEIERWKKIR